MPKYHVRRKESKLFRLKELIGELTIKVAIADARENKSEILRAQKNLERIFRYATAIGMNTYEVKMKCSFEFTTKVCGFKENDAPFDAVNQIWNAVPNILIREQHLQSMKEISNGKNSYSESF